MGEMIQQIAVSKTYDVVSYIHGRLEDTLKDHGCLGRLLLKLRKRKFLMIFGERDDDIYICTFPRSGTTWVQMIVYQLITDGNMDFDHIYAVSPFPEKTEINEMLLSRIASPRIIKSHDSYDEMAKRKGRFIYVIRNGMDVAVSLYHHRRAYVSQEFTFDDAFDIVLKEWITHVYTWLRNEKNREILFLKYEEMLIDMEATIRRIADFVNIKIKEAEFPRIVERSSFDFMKKHEDKFGEQPSEHIKAYGQFIRKGKADEGHKYFSEGQKKLYRENFREYFDGFEIMESYKGRDLG